MYCITGSPTAALRSKMVAAFNAGMIVSEIARQFRVARSTVYRWLRRASLETRCSVPLYQPRRTPPEIEERVRLMREQTGRGPWYIGCKLGMPTSTVYKILLRLGLNRKPQAPLEPIRRYEHRYPGSLVHVDGKTLGSKGIVRMTRTQARAFKGRCLHVMEDDCSRVVFAAEYPDETAATAAEFLERGIAYFASLGVTVQRVLTDNGAAYRSDRWRVSCQLLGVGPHFTKPRRPQTNGKVERWMRTLNEEALPSRILPSEEARTVVIENFVIYYNTRRPHKALGGKTPLQRLVECREAV